MKTKINTCKQVCFVIIACCIIQQSFAQPNTFPSTGSAGIGTATPNASSILEMVSSSKGMLVPRMTKNQRDAIVTPATGLLIYQTNFTPGFYYYNGTAWTAVSVKSKGWSLTGNAGTVPGTNFIGTTDAQPLMFKIKNNKAGYIDFDAVKANTGFGYQTLFSNSSGFGNTGIGYQALYSNSTGAANTANGYQSFYSNTTGGANTANGYQSLYANTTGNYNTANGYGSLYFNTTGYNNTANGSSALNYNTTGYNNTANGMLALYSNTIGSFNTANGVQALSANTTGSYNTANGQAALYSNTTGTNNTASGLGALFSNTTGNDNTANGLRALYSNTTGDNNTATGLDALYSNTTGYSNTANGSYALTANTTGVFNTANGLAALYFNTTGSYNTADGHAALHSNTTGIGNTANGYEALYSSTTANFNTTNGYQSLYFNTTGEYNTANGSYALYSNTSGADNTALGAGADVLTGDLINATAIGSSATVDASNKVRVGNTGVNSIGGQVGWTTFSDGRYKKNIKEDVKGLSFINSLRPVIYTVDIHSLNEYYDKGRKHDSAYEKMKADIQPSTDEAAKILYNGFIAQEVEAAAKKLNYDFSGVDKPKAKDGLYGLRYAEFVVPLVKAVQELSAKNDDLQKQIDELKTIVLSGNQDITSAQSSKVISINNSSLEQNIPNPFNKLTVINYTLPANISSAQIIVTDNSGKVMKQVKVSGAGKGSLQIDASALSSGAYQYSLIVDGKIISTKQMVLTK